MNITLCIAKSIKILCAYKDINITQLGYKLGLSKENFHAQIKRDNFRMNDVVKIVDILGYDVKVQFTDRESGKVIEVEREKAEVKNKPIKNTVVQNESEETTFENWKTKYEEIIEIPTPQNLIPLDANKIKEIEFPWDKI